MNNTGGLVAEIRYTAWGESRYTSGTTPTARRYTGQIEESGLGGLYFYNARWYEPGVGRFVQADTVVPGAGNPQALNRYSYVLNAPLRHTDPTGYLPSPCGNPDGQGYGAGCNANAAPKTPRVAGLAQPTSNWQLRNEDNDEYYSWVIGAALTVAMVTVQVYDPANPVKPIPDQLGDIFHDTFIAPIKSAVELFGGNWQPNFHIDIMGPRDY